jgi:hypothetical protein
MRSMHWRLLQPGMHTAWHTLQLQGIPNLVGRHAAITQRQVALMHVSFVYFDHGLGRHLIAYVLLCE